MQSTINCVTHEDKLYLSKVQDWAHDIEIVATLATLATDEAEIEEILSFMAEMSRQFAEFIHQHKGQKRTRPEHKLPLLVM